MSTDKKIFLIVLLAAFACTTVFSCFLLGMGCVDEAIAWMKWSFSGIAGCGALGFIFL